jgi:hypothetical protein
LTRRALDTESGYSVVEVLAAIVILTVAILPMVGMFDAALQATGAGGDYDAARACANGVLEEAKSLPYETVETGLPQGVCPEASGFAYEIDEDFVDASLREVGTDEGLIRLTVIVSWARGSSYDVTGVLSRW